jgi:hypothetical protein
MTPAHSEPILTSYPDIGKGSLINYWRCVYHSLRSAIRKKGGGQQPTFISKNNGHGTEPGLSRTSAKASPIRIPHAPHHTVNGEGHVNQVEENPPDDIAYNLRTAHIKCVNWQYGWGSETQWESEFNAQLSIAREEGQEGVDGFFRACETHVVEGWEILKDLRFAASMSCNSTHDEIRDLFLQGYEMVIAMALEVKFFDMKLHQYTPAISTATISKICMYSEN